MRVRTFSALLLLLTGCAPDVPDMSTLLESGSMFEVEQQIVPQFNLNCGVLSSEDAQAITGEAGVEALIGRVFVRPEACDDGDEDCDYSEAESLAGNAGLKVDTQEKDSEPFEHQYRYVTWELGGVFGQFDIEGGVSSESAVQVSGRHDGAAALDEGVEELEEAWLQDNRDLEVDAGYVYYATTDAWSLEVHQAVEARVAARDPTGSFALEGSYYSASGMLQTVQRVTVCLESLR